MGALLAYLYLSFLPNEIAVFVGSVRLEPYRIFLIGYFVYSLLSGQGKLIAKYERFLVLAILWVFLSNLSRRGGAGIEASVIYFMEVWVGYLIGRNSIRSLRDFYSFVQKYIGLLVILVPFAIYESQTGHRILHVLASSITGISSDAYLGMEYYRYGVRRSSTIFSHPILYSVCSAALFIFVLLKVYDRSKSLIFACAIIVALVSAMTSAGILMVLLAIGLFLLERVSKSFVLVKPLLLYGFGLFLVSIELLSNRGAVKFLMSSLALNPQTAYMRYAQYEYSRDDILSHPIFGTGGEWTRPINMPGSIDNYWIVMALGYGLPNLVFTVLFWYGLGRGLYLHRNYSAMLFGAYVSMTSLGVAALTVHLFDRAHILTYLILGVYSGLLYSVKCNNKFRSELSNF